MMRGADILNMVVWCLLSDQVVSLAIWDILPVERVAQNIENELNNSEVCESLIQICAYQEAMGNELLSYMDERKLKPAIKHEIWARKEGAETPSEEDNSIPF